MARKSKKISQRAFLQSYQKELSRHQDVIHDLVTDYLVGRSPVEDGKVYMVTSTRHVRPKRVVILRQNIATFSGTQIIRIGGWILDKEGNNVKWDNWFAHGVSNPSIFELAEDQRYKIAKRSNFVRNVHDEKS